MKTDPSKIKYIETQINYVFQNKVLLKTAITHRSYLHEKFKDPDITHHNERLEFLGDAVLELVVTEYLYSNLNQDEGVMTTLRASLVNYKIIGKIGQSLGLDTKINLSSSEKEELGRARLSIVADAVEAIIGAIHLDGGYKLSKTFIEKFVLVKLPEILNKKTYKDYKTLLQELCQKKLKSTPKYKVIFTEGKDHKKKFYVGVWINGQLYTKGEGKSKQEAETQAAKKAYLNFCKTKYSTTDNSLNPPNLIA